MKIKFKKLHPDAVIPAQSTEYAGGWDVTCTQVVFVDDHVSNKVICRLGFAMQPEKGYRIVIVPRSNLTKHNWVINNSPGTGDADYDKEYEVRFTAIPTGIVTSTFDDGKSKSRLTYDEFPYKKGERIAQMYLEKVEDIEWSEEEFEDYKSTRIGGFGSTGL